MRPTLDVLLQRDNWHCGLCGDPIYQREDANREHLVSRYHGGPKELEWNLVPAHRDCNHEKRHRAPKPEQIRWELAKPNEVEAMRKAVKRIAWYWGKNVPSEVKAFLLGGPVPHQSCYPQTTRAMAYEGEAW